MSFGYRFTQALGKFTQQIIDIDPNAGKLRYCPDEVIWLSFYMSVSGLAIAISDLGLEVFGLIGVFAKVPFRPEYLFLVIISALLSNFTLKGLRRREIDITQNSVVLDFVVECSIFLSDILFILFNQKSSYSYMIIRIPFLILTFINICILLYIMLRLRLFGFGFKIPQSQMQNFQR